MKKLNTNKASQVDFVSYITDKNGVKHYAKEYGLKAFPIPHGRKKKAKA